MFIEYISAKPRKCYDVGLAHFYRGHQNKTQTGRQCQKWDAKKPHEPYNDIYLSPHNFPENSVKDAKNYCRDLDGEGKPWCYTTDPDTRWEFCDIPKCSANSDCYKEGYPWLYKGNTNVTKGMLECQRWEHFSNNTNWTWDFKYPDSSLSEANNYCRSPRGKDQPWCYTDGNKSWDFCDIKQCPKDYCYEDVSRNYQGQMMITETGRECQRWDSTFPHRHSYGSMALKFPDNSVSDAANYCRDPSSSGRPWCYTTDAEKKWDWCAVWKC
ncbi:plasminogen-like [Mercenaria mercenaria]|uniref:plasminogen-like n=1 Tax=Mercenaria mercenaria TaxID=6596 RepID=UPI00234F5358|nr:plasminogen-like [Mercenaria mercenaria]